MADVRGGTVASRGEGRGQLILVAAVGIAALLLTLSLLLNAAVYTETLATRSGHEHHADAAVDHRLATERAVGGLLTRSNAAGWTYDQFAANVSTWNDRSARANAAGGITTSVTVSATESTRVVHDDLARPFTSASLASQWTVLESVTTSKLSAWTVTFQNSSLAAPSATTNASDLRNASVFGIAFETSEVRQVFVYRDGGGAVVVAVDDTVDPVEACSAAVDANGTVTVDVRNGTVGGDGCEPLATLWSTLGTGDPFDVRFDDGDRAAGTYELLVERPVAVVTDTDYATDGSSPYLAGRLSDVTVDVSYTTRGLRFVARGVPVTEVTP